MRKEGKETVFWLRVIGRTNKTYEREADVLILEGKEIVAIVSTIIRNTKKSK